MSTPNQIEQRLADKKDRDWMRYRDYVARYDHLSDAEIETVNDVVLAVNRTVLDLATDAKNWLQVQDAQLRAADLEQARIAKREAAKAVADYDQDTQTILDSRIPLRVALFETKTAYENAYNACHRATVEATKLREQAPHLYPNDPQVKASLESQARQKAAMDKQKLYGWGSTKQVGA